MKASFSNLFVSDIGLSVVCNPLEKCTLPLSGFNTESDKQMTSLQFCSAPENQYVRFDL